MDGIKLICPKRDKAVGMFELPNPSGGTGLYKNCTIPSDPKSSDEMNLTSVPLDGVVYMNPSSFSQIMSRLATKFA